MYGASDADAQSFYRGQPLPNEIPICLAGGLTLSVTKAHAVWIDEFAICSTGVTFTVHSVLRDPREDQTRGYFGDGFFGVEFSDGTAISTQSWDGIPGLTSQGGGGNNVGWVSKYFLHPIPPDGLTRFYFLHTDYGVPECSDMLDTTGWRDRGAQVKSLWPLKVPERQEAVPAQVTFPAESWFRQFLES